MSEKNTALVCVCGPPSLCHGPLKFMWMPAGEDVVEINQKLIERDC